LQLGQSSSLLLPESFAEQSSEAWHIPFYLLRAFQVAGEYTGTALL